MTNPNPSKKDQFNSETAKEAGKKSRRGVSLKTSLKTMFEDEAENGGKLTAENFVKACTIKAMKGNSGLAKMIFEYIDGKVKEEVEITANNINIEVTTDDLEGLSDEEIEGLRKISEKLNRGKDENGND